MPKITDEPKVCGICLTPSIKTEGQQLAYRTGRSFSGFIDHLIRRELEREAARREAVLAVMKDSKELELA
jgi:hypothetical protein